MVMAQFVVGLGTIYVTASVVFAFVTSKRLTKMETNQMWIIKRLNGGSAPKMGG